MLYQDSLKHACVYWLRQMPVEAGRRRLVHVLGQRIACQGHKEHVLELLILPKCARLAKLLASGLECGCQCVV